MASQSRRRPALSRGSPLLTLCFFALAAQARAEQGRGSCSDPIAAGSLDDVTSVLQVNVQVERRVGARRSGTVATPARVAADGAGEDGGPAAAAATAGAAASAAGQQPLQPPVASALMAIEATVAPPEEVGMPMIKQALTYLIGKSASDTAADREGAVPALLSQMASDLSARARQILAQHSHAGTTSGGTLWVVVMIMLIMFAAVVMIVQRGDQNGSDPPETRKEPRTNDMATVKTTGGSVRSLPGGGPARSLPTSALRLPVAHAAEAARQAGSQASVPGRGPRPTSPAPSPRTITQIAASRASIGRRLQLAEPTTWAAFEGLYFSIRPEQLPADVGAMGDFDVICGGATSSQVIRCSVMPSKSRQGRELVLKTASPQTGVATRLSSCIPAAMREPCQECLLMDKDGASWGNLVQQGEDSYAVVHRGAQVLSLLGDEDAGRLVVMMGNETVALAAQRADGNALEVGVKAHIDPILMLTTILAVVIFNPQPEYTPTPVPSQRSQLPGR